MVFIQDGTGKGFTAQVDDENKLAVGSTGHTEEHSISANEGLAFNANAADTANTLTLATGNKYNLIFLQNTSNTEILVVQEIAVSADTAGLVLIVQKNMTLGVVGDNNVHVPANLNFSSGKSAEATCHTWDETGTTGVGGLTVGTVVSTFILGVGATILPIEGVIVIGQNDNIVLRTTNGTGGNVEVAANINFYFDDATG